MFLKTGEKPIGDMMIKRNVGTMDRILRITAGAGQDSGTGRKVGLILAALQAEYRLPVWDPLGVAAFAGWGDVSSRPGDFKLSGLKFSAGAGLRLVLNKSERTLLRLDFGWGRGTSGMYFTAGEAF